MTGRSARGWKSIAVVAVVAAIAAVAPAGAGAQAAAQPGKRTLRIGTTASLERSGLLAVLLPVFAQESGLSVRVVGKGTVPALALGRRGEVDVLLSPESPAEAELVSDGFVLARTPVLEAHYVIAGPPADPAGVRRAASPSVAVAQVFRLRMPFVRRADDSDVRERERALFTDAGIDPDQRWEALDERLGGMRDALETAARQKAYVVADQAAFLSTPAGPQLVVLSRPSPALAQVFSVLELDPTRVTGPISSEAARTFARFLVSPAAQRRIAEFRIGSSPDAVFRPLAASTTPRKETP